MTERKGGERDIAILALVRKAAVQPALIVGLRGIVLYARGKNKNRFGKVTLAFGRSTKVWRTWALQPAFAKQEKTTATQRS